MYQITINENEPLDSPVRFEVWCGPQLLFQGASYGEARRYVDERLDNLIEPESSVCPRCKGTGE